MVRLSPLADVTPAQRFVLLGVHGVPVHRLRRAGAFWLGVLTGVLSAFWIGG